MIIRACSHGAFLCSGTSRAFLVIPAGRSTSLCGACRSVKRGERQGLRPKELAVFTSVQGHTAEEGKGCPPASAFVPLSREGGVETPEIVFIWQEFPHLDVGGVT